MDSSFRSTILLLAAVATIIGLCVAVTALIPQFGQWLFPRAPALPSPLPSLTSPSEHAATNRATQAIPAPTPDPICNEDFYVRESAAEGTRRTYVRCPVGEVEYSIQVDDLLESMVFECPGKAQQQISFLKNQQLSAGEQLPTFDSMRFTSASGCKVQITIVNTIANKIGYTIRQEVIVFSSLATSPTARANPCSGADVTYDGTNVTIVQRADCHVSLEAGEVIAGTADRFQDNVELSEQPPCTAFVIRGPVEMDLKIWYGGWNYHVNIYDHESIQGYLAEKIAELRQHQT